MSSGPSQSTYFTLEVHSCSRPEDLRLPEGGTLSVASLVGSFPTGQEPGWNRNCIAPAGAGSYNLGVPRFPGSLSLEVGEGTWSDRHPKLCVASRTCGLIWVKLGIMGEIDPIQERGAFLSCPGGDPLLFSGLAFLGVVVQLLPCLTLCDSMDSSMLGFPALHGLLELA